MVGREVVLLVGRPRSSRRATRWVVATSGRCHLAGRERHGRPGPAGPDRRRPRRRAPARSSACAGWPGNGQRELAEVVGRDARRRRGHASTVAGTPAAGPPTRGRPSAAGVAHVPEDRLHTGTAPSLPRRGQPGAHRLPLGAHVVRPVRAPRPDPGPGRRAHGALRRARPRAHHARPRSSRAATCSGCCWPASCQRTPQLLVAASPTRGLDVGRHRVGARPARAQRRRRASASCSSARTSTRSSTCRTASPCSTRAAWPAGRPRRRRRHGARPAHGRRRRRIRRGPL